MELIKQEDDSTCRVACAAMVARVSFETAMEKTKYIIQSNGTTPRNMGLFLRKLKVQYTRKIFPELNRTVPYIVTAPSLNVIGGLHYIVVDLSNGFIEVYDPQCGRPNKKFYKKHLDDKNGTELTSYAEVIRINNFKTTKESNTYNECIINR